MMVIKLYSPIILKKYTFKSVSCPLSRTFDVKSVTVLPMTRHRCDISCVVAVLPAGAMTRRWIPPTRYTLRRITGSLMKDLI